jgi:hypothetical protein
MSLLTLVFDCVQTLQVFDACVKLVAVDRRRVAMATSSRLFVRNSTGLVRSASAVDATIFNAVISAPVGSTIAYSIFFTLVAFPGADVAEVILLVAAINIPVLIMFALLGASMPRVGGDYV